MSIWARIRPKGDDYHYGMHAGEKIQVVGFAYQPATASTSAVVILPNGGGFADVPIDLLEPYELGTAENPVPPVIRVLPPTEWNVSEIPAGAVFEEATRS